MESWKNSGFVREGGTLGQWLPLLVAAHEEDRSDAAEAIGGMWKGTRTYSSREEVPKGEGDFGEAVRAAVNAEGFKRGEFVRKLVRLRREVGRGRDAMKPVGMVSYLVFQALGEELMEAEEELGEMLADRQTASYAREAIVRMGPKGKRFAPALLRELDAVAGREMGFEGAEALAAVGRGDAGVVGELVARLRGGNEAVKAGAAEVLEEMGEDVAGKESEIVEGLRGMLGTREVWGRALLALASVGREREDVMREVVGYARPREARWVTVKNGKYEERVDEVMRERALAIEGLKRFSRFPAEVVPVLADALDSFQEYDPDWEYELAEHGRVVAALRAFGADAVGAVPALARHVKRVEDGGEDPEVVRLLGEMGPGAREALPALEALWRETGEERSNFWDEGELPTKEYDPLAWAIGRIRGEIG